MEKVSVQTQTETRKLVENDIAISVVKDRDITKTRVLKRKYLTGFQNLRMWRERLLKLKLTSVQN